MCNIAKEKSHSRVHRKLLSTLKKTLDKLKVDARKLLRQSTVVKRGRNYRLTCPPLFVQGCLKTLPTFISETSFFYG